MNVLLLTVSWMKLYLEKSTRSKEGGGREGGKEGGMRGRREGETEIKEQSFK